MYFENFWINIIGLKRMFRVPGSEVWVSCSVKVNIHPYYSLYVYPCKLRMSKTAPQKNTYPINSHPEPAPRIPEPAPLTQGNYENEIINEKIFNHNG